MRLSKTVIDQLQAVKFSEPSSLEALFSDLKALLDSLFAIYQSASNSVFTDQKITDAIFLHNAVCQITREKPATKQIRFSFTVHQITTRYLQEKEVPISVDQSKALQLDFDHSFEFSFENEGGKEKLLVSGEEVG